MGIYKNITLAFVCFLLSVLCCLNAHAQEGEKAMDIKSVLARIEWLGHASFKIETPGGDILYIDPWKLSKKYPEADVILVTHEHYDHLSAADIERLQKENTIVVTIPLCAPKITGKIKTIRPGEGLQLGTIKITAMPAYNIKKPFHPKADGRVGFIIDIESIRIYHAGDTDLIPEMKDIKADIALLPVSGTYVMNSKEAAEAARLIKPTVAVPMHYGDPDVAGTLKDAQDFAEILKGSTIDVHILQSK